MISYNTESVRDGVRRLIDLLESYISSVVKLTRNILETSKITPVL